MKKKKAVWSIGILIVIVLGIWGIYNNQASPGEYDDFAVCLTEQGAKIYGTDWCSFCKQQKDMFGKSFKYVNYVNCDFNKDECSSEGIQGYPTWKIDGEAYSGVQQFQRLSALTGCEL